MSSSHVKRSLSLWLHNDSRLCQSRRFLNGLYIISINIINRTLHGRLKIRNLSLRLETNFVFPRGHVISVYVNDETLPYRNSLDFLGFHG